MLRYLRLLVTNSGRTWSFFGPVAVATVLVLAAAFPAMWSVSLAVLAIAAVVGAVVAVTANRGARLVSRDVPEGSPSSAPRS